MGSWRKGLLHWLRDRIAPWSAGRLLRLYSRLWSWEIIGNERVEEWLDRGPVIYVHWHGDDLALLPAFAHGGVTMMVSRSRDGDLAAQILAQFGYGAVRGSDSRDGVSGLKELIRLVRSGRSVGLTIDGPTGPRERVKPGVIALAKLTGAPILPAGVWAARRYLFAKTWHQTYLPLPGSRVRYVFAEPILVPPQASAEEMEAKRLELEREMMRLREEARLGVGER